MFPYKFENLLTKYLIKKVDIFVLSISWCFEKVETFRHHHLINKGRGEYKNKDD